VNFLRAFRHVHHGPHFDDGCVRGGRNDNISTVILFINQSFQNAFQLERRLDGTGNPTGRFLKKSHEKGRVFLL
jgi:hypothetical protein